MKIGDFIPQIKTDNKIGKTRGGKEAESSSAASQVGDRVDISASSLDVQKMKGIIQNTPDLRMDRVQALKEQIERGDYEVDPYRVADKMLMNLLAEGEITK